MKIRKIITIITKMNLIFQNMLKTDYYKQIIPASYTRNLIKVHNNKSKETTFNQLQKSTKISNNSTSQG